MTTQDKHFAATMESPVGRLTIVATDTGLRAVLWPADDPNRVPLPETEPGDSHPVASAARKQLNEYFNGERQTFDLPLDLRGTDFQQQNWLALQEIEYGRTASYGDQANRLGRPKAARAVGAATGKNPLSVVLPCHRVVGSDGSMTGFAGGIETKQWLLSHEQGN